MTTLRRQRTRPTQAPPRRATAATTRSVRPRSTSPEAHDLETRERVLQTAARLFATHGFSKVTVREICGTANANIASVNYHFGDKTGLYHEVIQRAILTMQETTREMMRAGEGRSPEQRLEASIRAFLQRLAAAGDSWLHQLMVRELSEPTPALDMIIEQVILPRFAYFSDTVSAIMRCPPDDERVARCVMSVHVQVLAVVNSRMATRLHLPTQPALTLDRLEDAVHHITRFSIAGIHAVKKP